MYFKKNLTSNCSPLHTQAPATLPSKFNKHAIYAPISMALLMATRSTWNTFPT